MTLYENIKAMRQARRMSQEELAKKTGYSDRSSIAKIEKGEVDLSQSKIQAFADVFHVSPSELMDDKLSPSKKSTGISIPLYGPICCGNGGFVDDNLIEMISLPADVLKPRRDYFAQRAKGDSMIGANIHDGDILVFEKSSTIENGQIGCFCLDDNEAVCKRYRVLAGGQICLMPENPDYSPILIDVTFQNFRCIGLLIVNIENMVGR